MSVMLDVSEHCLTPYGYTKGKEYVAEFHRIEKVGSPLLRIKNYSRLLADKDFYNKVNNEMYANTCWNLAVDYCLVAEMTEEDNNEKAIEYYQIAQHWFQQSLSGYKHMMQDVPRFKSIHYREKVRESRTFVTMARDQIHLIGQKLGKLQAKQAQQTYEDMELGGEDPKAKLVISALQSIPKLQTQLVTDQMQSVESLSDHDALCDQIEAIAELDSYSEKANAVKALPEHINLSEAERRDLADSYWNLSTSLKQACYQQIQRLKSQLTKTKETKAELTQVGQHYQLASRVMEIAEDLYTESEDKLECAHWVGFNSVKATNILRAVNRNALEGLFKCIRHDIDIAALWDFKRNGVTKKQLPPAIKFEADDVMQKQSKSSTDKRYQQSDVPLTPQSDTTCCKPVPLWFIDELKEETLEDEFDRVKRSSIKDESDKTSAKPMTAKKVSRCKGSSTSMKLLQLEALEKEKQQVLMTILEIKREYFPCRSDKVSKIIELTKRLNSLKLTRRTKSEKKGLKRPSSPQIHKTSISKAKRALRHSIS